MWFISSDFQFPPLSTFQELFDPFYLFVGSNYHKPVHSKPHHSCLHLPVQFTTNSQLFLKVLKCQQACWLIWGSRESSSAALGERVLQFFLLDSENKRWGNLSLTWVQFAHPQGKVLGRDDGHHNSFLGTRKLVYISWIQNMYFCITILPPPHRKCLSSMLDQDSYQHNILPLDFQQPQGSSEWSFL